MDIEENSENASLESNLSDREIFSENYKFLHINEDLENKNENLRNELIEEQFTILIVDDNVFNLFVLEK